MKKAVKVLMLLFMLAFAMFVTACGSDQPANETETASLEQGQPATEAAQALAGATVTTPSPTETATTAAEEDDEDEDEEDGEGDEGEVTTPRATSNAGAVGLSSIGEEIATRINHTPLQMFSLIGDIVESGASTTTINFNFITPSPQEPNLDGYITFALDTNAEEAMLAGEVRILGIPLDFTLLVNSERLALQSRIIDRDNFYGITFETAFEDAIEFLGLLGITPEEIDMLLAEILGDLGELAEIFEQLEDLMLQIEAMENDFAAQIEWAEDYAIAFENFVARSTAVAESVTLTRAGASVPAYRTSFLVTEEELLDLFYQWLVIFENDEMWQATWAMYDNPIFEGEIPTFDEILDELWLALEVLSVLEGVEVEAAVYTSESGRVVQVTIEAGAAIDGFHAGALLVLDFGNSVTDPWTFTFVAYEDGVELLNAAIVWAFESTAAGYVNSIVVADMFEISSVWDPSSGRFAFAVEEFSFGGSFIVDGQGFELALDRINIPFVGSIDLGITMEAGADIPAADFINLDQWGWELIELIEGSLFGLLFMMF